MKPDRRHIDAEGGRRSHGLSGASLARLAWLAEGRGEWEDAAKARERVTRAQKYLQKAKARMMAGGHEGDAEDVSFWYAELKRAEDNLHKVDPPFRKAEKPANPFADDKDDTAPDGRAPPKKESPVRGKFALILPKGVKSPTEKDHSWVDMQFLAIPKEARRLRYQYRDHLALAMRTGTRPTLRNWPEALRYLDDAKWWDKNHKAHGAAKAGRGRAGGVASAARDD